MSQLTRGPSHLVQKQPKFRISSHSEILKSEANFRCWWPFHTDVVIENSLKRTGTSSLGEEDDVVTFDQPGIDNFNVE